jgi:hypothetical protein
MNCPEMRLRKLKTDEKSSVLTILALLGNPEFGKTEFHRNRLDSEASTALGTARSDDSATTTGFHAHQEAMGAGATNFRRLVSTFHKNLR